MATDPAQHWTYQTGRWLLAHGLALVPVAFVLLLLLAAVLLALAWLQGGARLIVAVWVWRQALAWWRARAPTSRPGGAGGRSALYQAVMASSAWRRRRRQALRRAGRRCQRCGARGPLDVHHLTYRALGRERPGDLLALCESCHGALHGRPRGG
jgi:hypothetical protein